MNNAVTTALGNTSATASAQGGGNYDRLTAGTRNYRIGLVVALLSLLAIAHSFYYFLFAGLTNRADHLTIAWLILIPSLTLTAASTYLFFLKKDDGLRFGVLALFVAGLMGVIEGVAILWAVYGENSTLYELFNFNGFVSLAGVVLVLFMLQMYTWSKPSKY